MHDDVTRFWIPMASILPVFILGLVIEARVSIPALQIEKSIAVSPRRSGIAKLVAIADRVSVILYALTYVGAMILLVLAFLASALVLAGGEPTESAKALVLFVAVLAVVFTGLLPTSRLLKPVWREHAARPVLRWVYVHRRARDVRRLKKRE